jgi:Txe/YoeB family toxin of Txe-Axe toxin-antitoxin module
MATRVEINNQIGVLNELLEDFISYNDAISFTDSNQKVYVTSDTLVENVKKSNYSAIQALEELKKTSLTQYEYVTQQDTTILNLCFILYGQITEENITKLLEANDFQAFNTLDFDPNDPIIKRETTVIYYK